MAFVKNAKDIAREAMDVINPSLSDKYASVIHFLSTHPETAAALRGTSAPTIGSEEYVRRQASAFSLSREVRAPKPPNTVPDEMVSVILISYFDINKADTERIKREHLLGSSSFRVEFDSENPS